MFFCCRLLILFFFSKSTLSIPARSHTFVEIDHEIITVILLPSAESFMKGCCQLHTGPSSAVGNVSGYRCVSDCNPGVASSIPARSHTFVEIDHEIISMVILLPSADSFKKGCCQLQAKVCARITGYALVQACPGKSVVR